MKTLHLKIQKASEELMQKLEDNGCIIRLLPSKEKHRINVDKDAGKGEYVYRNRMLFGSHCLLSCAIDNSKFYSFATHPDKEDVLLLGGVDEKKLIFIISMLKREEFLTKLYTSELSEDDFIVFEAVYNDPYLSFFSIIENTPHGECAIGDKKPATFYVTESSNLPLDKIRLYDYYDVILQ